MVQYGTGKVPPKLLTGYNGITDKFYPLFIDIDGAAKVKSPQLPADLSLSGNLKVSIEEGGGGGVEYTEGDVDATIVGKTILGEAPNNTLEALQLDASKYLKVIQQGNITETNSTAIKTALEIIDNIVSGNEAQVDVITSALPAGAATEATLAAIKIAIEIIDNMISGNEAQVDVITLPAIPTGANVIGSIKITDGTETLSIDTDNRVEVATKHDGTIYKTKYVSLAADGNLIAGVASKKIRVHFLSVQAIADAVFLIVDKNGGATVDKWALNAREGSNLPFVPNPAFHYESQTSEELYCNFTSAGEVKFTLIYSEETP